MGVILKRYWPLVLLLALDVILIILHFLNFYKPIGNYNAFFMEGNDSYAETFQNIKWIGMVVLSIMIAVIKKDKKYFSWTILFVFLALEDVFRIHQLFTSFISQSLLDGISRRQWKILEMVVASLLGLLMLIPLIVNYRKGSDTFRRHSKILVGLLLLLVFFGLVMDQAHRLYYIWSNWKREFIVGVIEDGGEMITASLILGFLAFIYMERNKAPLPTRKN